MGFFFFRLMHIDHTNLFSRPSLAKYHTRMLSLPGDGTGKWTITRIGTAEERMGIDKEIVALEGQLAEVGNWEARLKELNKLLGIDKS